MSPDVWQRSGAKTVPNLSSLGVPAEQVFRSGKWHFSVERITPHAELDELVSVDSRPRALRVSPQYTESISNGMGQLPAPLLFGLCSYYMYRLLCSETLGTHRVCRSVRRELRVPGESFVSSLSAAQLDQRHPRGRLLILHVLRLLVCFGCFGAHNYGAVASMFASSGRCERLLFFQPQR